MDQQQAQYNQFMQQNANVVTNDVDKNTSYKFDEEKGVMVMNEDITVHKITELTPNGFRAIYNQWEQQVKQTQPLKPIISVCSTSHLDALSRSKESQDLLKTFKDQVAQTDLIQAEVEKANPEKKVMDAWLKKKGDEEKAMIEKSKKAELEKQVPKVTKD